MPGPRAVFLDAGGTLIHADRPFLLQTLSAHGVACSAAALVAAEQQARERIGQVMRTERPGNDATRARLYWATVLDALGCDAEARDAVVAAVLRHNAEGRLWCHVEAGTREALRALRAEGLVLGVVSNSDGRVARFLERAGLADLLDFIIDSGRVGCEKPDPRIFEVACRAAGVEAAEAVHVGDIYEIDVVGARAAGIDAVLIAPESAAIPAGVERLSSVAELPALLGRRALAQGGSAAG